MNKIAQYSRQSPHGYEKQTMVLMDEAGNRDVRKLRRYLRLEKDGTTKHLMIFDYPAEVRGVSLLAIIKPSGERDNGVYLPALGDVLKPSAIDSRSSNFLGTDFSIDDLNFDRINDFSYTRLQDQIIEETPYYVIEAVSRNHDDGYGMRHLYIRPDNYYIARIDYFNRHRKLIKRQTHHDLVQIEGDIWRANMILMDNYKERHKTLIKIDQRIFSSSYVPTEIFTIEWLQQQEGAKGERPEEEKEESSKEAG